jgi:beta-N-acetylhexosaminidase
VTATGTEILGRLMLAWDGRRLDAWMRARLERAPAAGVTLFRHRNVGPPDEVRALTDALQAHAPAGRPLLIAVDQEGGQFIGLGDATTGFPGNMALGATGDPGLTERVGRATGRELRALGVNVDYAPVCDLATNPSAPGLGVRSFGDDPVPAAEHAAAFVRGLQAQGVAATVKHFPGKGALGLDSHHALGVVTHDRARWNAVELAVFRAALGAGARMVMSGHFAAPGLSGSDDLPATLSRAVMRDLLRDDLGFDGVTITDALDMRALAQGPQQVVDVIAAIAAGVDLLLCAPDAVAIEGLEAGLIHAARRRLFDATEIAHSAARIDALRAWLGTAGAAPALDVVGSAEHRALAREVAERSVTLVRDDARLLPLRAGGGRVLAVMPRPADLTPADTSSAVPPGLAAALRSCGAEVDEVVVGIEPSRSEIAAVRDAARDAAVVVLGTISASLVAGQADLARAVIGTGIPTVTVALRTPWDLSAYPEAATHLCTYSILPESLDALARGLFGELPFRGALPVASTAVPAAAPA